MTATQPRADRHARHADERHTLRAYAQTPRFAASALGEDSDGKPYLDDPDGTRWVALPDGTIRRAVFREEPDDDTRPYMTAGAALLIAATIAVCAGLVLWGLSEWLA